MSAPVRTVGPDFLDAVRARLGPHDPSGGSLDAAVEAAARDAGAVLGSAALRSMSRTVRDELFGAGRLQVLLDDPEVTDVLVNGPRDVWVERAGRLGRADVDLGGPDDVRALAVRLAAAGGQRLDDASPAVDARLPDGTRLHAVLPPVAGTCALISLRVVRSRPFTIEQLVASGTLATALVPVVRALVATRANLLVSGATGSGKTTLLAALLSLVPHDERLVVVEEAGELSPAHPHVVRLLARHANVDGAGRVDLTDLVRHALRMRPDRIVLGECRGAEVREVLAALNTGHDGGCATVHANAAADVPARLEALAALAGMSRDALAAQAASAFDAVLHLRRGDRRYVAEVGVVRRAASGDLEVACALRSDASGVTVAGPAWPPLAARLGLESGRAGVEVVR
ncbi:TadA family conjugal transfer-associated ATPase [Cellulomonas fengjieae]|uniref:TadA family conjugal transfer-associated ATPase n=1 Tax=Cellulomonas fengjieae TaxID=2819978 RepID=A0ABS3SCE5_9CELL|nr:TadA family conjugal transfer-associated ATPase [Cellulomonas fengjieae]MBO3083415.1 TadA family conjugal transfer-associated ATPase [Cellulomonas fengjieae]MBO3101834.1 TadA family conjugal transfer-associated ATPase [Cellulomonas fengjieae]QVI65248.1 TadA family conjugal transfer-associated ATPase [Cellulomonas fengjieae]